MYRPLRISIPTLRRYSSPATKVLEPGDVFSQARTFSASDIAEYSKLTRDFNQIHSDPDRAKIAGFDGIPVPGVLVASLFPRIIASNFPGAVYARQTLEFRLPAYVGEEILGRVTAGDVRRLGENKFFVKFRTDCYKGAGDCNSLVIGGEATAILPSLEVVKLEGGGHGG
ncbi:superoxide dismutase [Striga asiatica]|uniref:Superoxide dismutase n=1 Tax=Striga asiatica TaxID=4170 RepID=A0A5A7Q1N4_STRAF|nr:superoxide dismutase [Striga asiatica]